MPEERKLVTILFADVTGSTSLGESLDPEDVRALMSRYYEHAREVIAAHGGTLEKFIGDAVVAVFGLPQAHSDDAERALAAALALREAVAHDSVLGESFQLRMGVNTGEVVATNDPSRGDFLVTGDTVNVAARLQQHASPGEIVAGQRTASAAQTAFLFDEARLAEVKGKKQPLQVFPLIGPRTVRKVERPPFVGRRQDMLQLQLLQARILEEQRPQLVSIVAPVGAGKTRLLEEFLNRLEPDDGFQVAMVRCLPYGQTLTYWPLRGLLDGLLEGEEITKSKMIGIFMQGGYKQVDADHLAGLVLSTLGIEGEGAATTDRESIFTAWRLLIEVFALQAPRILVFEDLHWASDSMLDLVEHVINLRTHAPLLLVVLSRPELLDRRPTWGGGRQNFTALALQPLTMVQMQDLLKKLAADLPEVTRKQIGDRSGGNPFFALEMVRGLIERGLTGEDATLDVLPDTVHAAVLARLDLLSKQERSVLQVAAVASRAIRTPLVHEILSEYSLQEIDAALDGLLQRDMLAPAEGSSFAFRNTLIRDVAYGTLSRSERIRLHSKIAEWLESSAGEHVDEYAELIAYHYREAVLLSRQSAVPKAMPTETAKAVHYLERAGELASRSGAFAEAKDYLEHAIALAPETEHMRLYEKLGESLFGGVAVIEAYRKALELWNTSNGADPLIGARLRRKLLTEYVNVRHTIDVNQEELNKLWTEALRLAEQAGNAGEVWRVRLSSLSLLLARGQITAEEMDEGRKTSLEAIAYFEQSEDQESFAEALEVNAVFSWLSGAHRAALESSQRRLAIPDLPLNKRREAIIMIASTYFLLGDYDACISTMLDALQELRAGEPIEYLGNGIAIAMWSTYVCGRWQETDILYKALGEAWDRIQQSPGATGMSLFGGYLVALQTAKAREDHAAMDAAASVLVSIQPDSTSIQDFITAIRDDELSKLQFKHISVETTGPILMLYSECGERTPARFMEASLFRDDMAIWGHKIAQALANGDDAHLASAIDEAEAHQLIVHAARMRVILAQRTGDRSQLERARPVLERIGDRRFLRNLEKVESELGPQVVG